MTSPLPPCFSPHRTRKNGANLTNFPNLVSSFTARHSCSLFLFISSNPSMNSSHLWNQHTFLYSQVRQHRRLSISLSVSERRPPKPTVCLLQREKSLLINLLQTAWRKWPGGCKLSLGEKDEGQNREGRMDRVWESEKGGWGQREERKKLRYKEMEKGGKRGGREKRERKECMCCVV